MGWGGWGGMGGHLLLKVTFSIFLFFSARVFHQLHPLSTPGLLTIISNWFISLKCPCVKQGSTLYGRSSPNDRFFTVLHDDLINYLKIKYFKHQCNTMHSFDKKQLNVWQFLR